MKTFQGKVISTKMKDTATIAVERIVVHPLYKKRMKRVKKYHVHDEIGVKVGQRVSFVDSKPVSKLKKWRLVAVINKSENKDTKQKKTKNNIWFS